MSKYVVAAVAVAVAAVFAVASGFAGVGSVAAGWFLVEAFVGAAAADAAFVETPYYAAA